MLAQACRKVLQRGTDMQLSFKLAMAASFTASIASAGGLDRSGQSVLSVFNDPGTYEFSYGQITPDITGTDDTTGTVYDVGKTYSQMTGSFTTALSDQIALSVIYDQPFGVNVLYNGTSTTDNLAGTGADLSSHALTFVGKYQVNENFSVFGGLRGQQLGGDVTLNGTTQAKGIATAAVAKANGIDATTLGAALTGNATAIAALGGAATVAGYGAAVTTNTTNFLAGGGYKLDVANDVAFGGLVGMAYEIPDIALRAALTYNHRIEHSLDTVENMTGLGQTNVASTATTVLPRSVNLDFQTGIAQNTLLIAGFRWAEWGSVDLKPTVLGSDLIGLKDSRSYSLGVARRFNDSFSGSITFQYEEASGEPVSALGPVDGVRGLTIGGRYTTGDVNFSGGINYSWLGDANAKGSSGTVATFSDNSSVGVGFNVEMGF